MRKIIHVDMDAFYAAVEQRDNPALRNRPVIVGGRPESRGVVSTCSYEARRYGVHSAMPTALALRRCPHAQLVPPDFHKYREVSEVIRMIFHRYTDLVEPLSLDEAFLDVTQNREGIPLATTIARRIKKEILQATGLTASAGVSYNKFLAKVASDYRKPDGLTVIPPDRGVLFIAGLPVRRFFGVGQATEARMKALGLHRGEDLQKKDRSFLIHHFGKTGEFFFEIARGRDPRPVNPHRERKSIGKERTFPRDINDMDRMRHFLGEISGQIAGWLQKHRRQGRTITVKVKYHDFQQVTRSITLSFYMDEASTIFHNACHLLRKTHAGKRKVRLLGVSVSNLK